jgi:hypothetical protein
MGKSLSLPRLAQCRHDFTVCLKVPKSCGKVSLYVIHAVSADRAFVLPRQLYLVDKVVG